MKYILFMLLVFLSCGTPIKNLTPPLSSNWCKIDSEVKRDRLWEQAVKINLSSYKCTQLLDSYYISEEEMEKFPGISCVRMPKIVNIRCDQDCNSGWHTCTIFHEDNYTLDIVFKDAVVEGGSESDRDQEPQYIK